MPFDTIPRRDLPKRDLLRGRMTTRESLPTIVKKRNIGEGIAAVKSGLIANRPAVGDLQEGLASIYFAEDENKLYVFNNTSKLWVSVTLS